MRLHTYKFRTTVGIFSIGIFYNVNSFIHTATFSRVKRCPDKLLSESSLSGEGLSTDDFDREILLREKQEQWKKMAELMQKGVIQNEEDMMMIDEMKLDPEALSDDTTISDNKQGNSFVVSPSDEISFSEEYDIEKDGSEETDLDRMALLKEKQAQWAQMKNLMESGSILDEEDMLMFDDDTSTNEELIMEGVQKQGSAILSDSVSNIQEAPSFDEYLSMRAGIEYNLDPQGMGVAALGLDWSEEPKRPGRRKKRKERQKKKTSTDIEFDSRASSLDHQNTPAGPKALPKTAEEYMRAIRKAEKNFKSHSEILGLINRSLKKELNDDRILSLGVKSLLRMKRMDEATKVHAQRLALLEESKLVSVSLNNTMSLFIAFVRAELPDVTLNIYDQLQGMELNEEQEIFTLLEVAGVLFNSNRNEEALRVLDQILTFPAERITIEGFNQLIRWLGRARLVDELLQLVDFISAQGLELNNESVEFMSNSIVQTVKMEKKCTSMRSLPSPNLPEIVLMGRSNAGKSSLINMLVNRKAMASTSATPGRTRHFTYYNVNKGRANVPGQSSASSFYLVDVPGLGFAETVDEGKIDSWKSLIMRYLQVRESLRAVFHLVDSRHGLQKADHDLMRMVKESGIIPRGGRYYLILTKMDKSKKEIEDNMQMVQQDIVQNGFELDDIPVLLTSSKTRLGKQELLRVIHTSLKE